MKFDRAANTMLITVTELASYAFQRENPAVLMQKFGFTKRVITPDEYDYADEAGLAPMRHGTAIHNVIETDAKSINVESVQTEVPLEKTTAVGGVTVTVQGFADIISYDGSVHTVEEVKTVGYMDNSLSPFSDPAHFAQAAVYAYMLSESVGLPSIMVRLTYVKRSNGSKTVFTAKFTQIMLLRMFDSLIERAAGFVKIAAERYNVYPDEVKKMPFPYRSMREGQVEFVKEAYRAMVHEGSLLVSAPTGIGKTISSIFPAVKATGVGKIDRIFYFTAKNVTGIAALDTAREITKYAPHFRSVMIQAKEQLCPYKKTSPETNLRLKCRFCEKVDSVPETLGKSSISYRERQIAALLELLSSTDAVYTVQRIRQTADQYNVCPYELSLDLSEYCTMIVCDYNYVIDDNIRFKRYFKDVKNRADEKYAFLFDEAHNLPDRARNTYSAVITTALADEIAALSDTYFLEDESFQAAANGLCDALSELRGACTDNEYLCQTEEGEVSGGFFESSRVPEHLLQSSVELAKLMYKYIRDGEDSAEVLEKYYPQISKIGFAAGFFDNKFRFFAARVGNYMKAEILCIDPSGIIQAMTSIAKSTIMFSATLSPMDYFTEVTGQSNAVTLELESPYERDNLCLISYDSLSTKLAYRRKTASDCAYVIAEAVSAKRGNYLVYFPSYDYMKLVCRLFAEFMPECDIVMQRQGMSYRERERFIEIFRERANKDEWVVGFCVLGGMFSEGIDLAGGSLIGAVIVGTGMPQLSAERNIMAAYYDEKTERGHDFAYTCPGMNKVLQAAGRVIRSENDRGAVILIDDRLNEPSMKLLFPKHWRHMKYTGDTPSMRSILDQFWNS